MNNIQKIINNILCDIKELKNTIGKKITILWEGTTITPDVSSINFTGNVEVFTASGAVTVNIPQQDVEPEEPIEQCCPVVDTYENIKTLMDNSELKSGVKYVITNADPLLYGGTRIELTAVSENKLSLEGNGLFYIPKYNNSEPNTGYGIWDASETYAIGDSVIWGGMHWINLEGNVGNSIDIFTLNDADWELVPFNDTDYDVFIDEIHFDFQNNAIIYRKDRAHNEVSVTYSYITELIEEDGYGLFNPIKVFQWNNYHKLDVDTYHYIGTERNIVKNSYFECINFRGEFNAENNLSEYGEIRNNSYSKNCKLTYNVLRGRLIRGNTFQSANINGNFDHSIFNNIVTASTIGSNTGGGCFSNTLTNAVIWYNTFPIMYSGSISNNVLSINNRIADNIIGSHSSISGNINSTITGNQLNGGFYTNKSVSIGFNTNCEIHCNVLHASSGTCSINNNLRINIESNNLNSSRIRNLINSDIFTSFVKTNILNNSDWNFTLTTNFTSKNISNIISNAVNISVSLNSATVIYNEPISKSLILNNVSAPYISHLVGTTVTISNLTA
jgi:hypothetical protein